MFHLMPYRDVPADFEQLSPPPHHVVVVVATPRAVGCCSPDC